MQGAIPYRMSAPAQLDVAIGSPGVLGGAQIHAVIFVAEDAQPSFVSAFFETYGRRKTRWCNTNGHPSVAAEIESRASVTSENVPPAWTGL